MPHLLPSRAVRFDGAKWRRCLFLLFFVVVISAFSEASERIEIEVRESAGLQRRGYPAHVLLTLPKRVAATTKFRLLNAGKSVTAQFRSDGDEPTANWWLDFQNELGPFESRQLTVEYGDDVTPVPERTSGHRLTTTDSHYSVTNAPYITWTIPRDLKGLVRSVKFQEFEFMRDDSPGLLIRDRQSREYSLSGTSCVVRQGTMTVALRYESTEQIDSLPGVRSTVNLTLPGPVSWMEIDCDVLDPKNAIAAIGMQLNLDLEYSDAAPILADFGTTGMVYMSLHKNHEAELIAGSESKDDRRLAWELLKYDAGRSTTFASGPRKPSALPVDGWLHVMDRKKCLALAIENFARQSNDRVKAGADGKVTIWREFPLENKSDRKQFRTWLHYVFFPPQQSAGASPQQMQSPLIVRQISQKSEPE